MIISLCLVKDENKGLRSYIDLLIINIFIINISIYMRIYNNNSNIIMNNIYRLIIMYD